MELNSAGGKHVNDSVVDLVWEVSDVLFSYEVGFDIELGREGQVFEAFVLVLVALDVSHSRKGIARKGFSGCPQFSKHVPIRCGGGCWVDVHHVWCFVALLHHALIVAKDTDIDFDLVKGLVVVQESVG